MAYCFDKYECTPPPPFPLTTFVCGQYKWREVGEYIDKMGEVGWDYISYCRTGYCVTRLANRYYLEKILLSTR